MLNLLCSKALSEMFGDIGVVVAPEDESGNLCRQLEQRILPPNEHFWVGRAIETQNHLLHRWASESIVGANIVIAQLARAAPQFPEIQRPVHRCHTQLSQQWSTPGACPNVPAIIGLEEAVHNDYPVDLPWLLEDRKSTRLNSSH